MLQLKNLIQSIQTCAANEFDTISINPTNIQMHTLCEELFNDQKFHLLGFIHYYGY